MNLYFRRYPTPEHHPHCSPTPCTWKNDTGDKCGRPCQYHAWTNDPQDPTDFYCAEHMWAALGQDWDRVTEMRSYEAHLTERDALYLLQLETLPVSHEQERNYFMKVLESIVGECGEELVRMERHRHLAEWEYVRNL